MLLKMLVALAALAPVATGCKNPAAPPPIPEKKAATNEPDEGRASALRVDSQRRTATVPEMDFTLALPERWTVEERSEENGGGAWASHPSGVRCGVITEESHGARLDEIVDRALEHAQEMPSQSWGNLGASRAVVTVEESDGYRVENRIAVRGDRYVVMSCEFENFSRPLDPKETSAALVEAWRAVTFLPTAGEDPTWQKAREAAEKLRAAQLAVTVDGRLRSVSIPDMTYLLVFPEGWHVQRMHVRDHVGFLAVHQRTSADCEGSLSSSKGRAASDIIRELVEQHSPKNDPKLSDGRLGETPAKVVRFDIGGEGTSFVESRVLVRGEKALVMTCSHREGPNIRADTPKPGVFADPTEGRDAVSAVWRAVKIPAR